MIQIEKKSLLLSLSITLLITGLLVYYMQIKLLNTTPLVKVYVATSNIKERTMITEKQITQISIPKKFLISGNINNKKNIIGKIAKENIYYGEQILSQKLILSNQNYSLSTKLPKGYRAISIKADNINGVAGHINSGDFVDILVYLIPPYTNVDTTKIIFQNVKVLDVGGQDKELITLCMSPKDAQKLFLLEQIGKLKLSLRQILDNEQIDYPEINSQSIQ